VTTPEPFRDVIRIDEGQLHQHLDQVVRDSVEQTLNALLDAEADRLCNARRYERSPDRLDTRAGSYTRALHTKAGAVELQVPRLRKLPFETQIIERYRRRESSVEEALIEMYLAGVSVRRVEDITEALWGTKVGPSTVSELNQKVYARIEGWRHRPIEGEHPYVFLDGIWLKRTWGGEVRNVAVLVAVGVNADGHRELLGVMEGGKGDAASWLAFLRHLRARPEGRAPRDLGQVPGAGGGAGRVLPGSAVAEVHSPLLPQRVHGGAVRAGEGGGGDAEGDPRPGGQGGGAGQGIGRRGETGGDEAE
jgi:transposase-like protein